MWNRKEEWKMWVFFFSWEEILNINWWHEHRKNHMVLVMSFYLTEPQEGSRVATPTPQATLLNAALSPSAGSILAQFLLDILCSSLGELSEFYSSSSTALEPSMLPVLCHVLKYLHYLSEYGCETLRKCTGRNYEQSKVFRKEMTEFKVHLF
jgi:hypothetical protein